MIGNAVKREQNGHLQRAVGATEEDARWWLMADRGGSNGGSTRHDGVLWPHNIQHDGEVQKMKSTLTLNRGMVNVEALATGVEVYGDVAAKMDGRDKETATQKKNADGVLGWSVSVLVNNQRLTTDQRLTLWSEKRPELADGDYVRFTGLACGAYSGRAGAACYVWASGYERVDDDDVDALVEDAVQEAVR